MSQSESIILHLNLISGVGPRTIIRLLEWAGVDGSSRLYAAHGSDLARAGIEPRQVERIVVGLADQKLLAAEQERVSRNGIQVITYQDPAYPVWLREIHAPPALLYVQGEIPPQGIPKVSVVGSRQANAYGRSVVERFVPCMVRAGYAIVSGGARGIDIHAHQIAVREGGKTVVVTGSGLLHPYPREHTHIFADIVAKGGAVVSAFPLDSVALAGNFPARNRIIAGLSKACLVVQAAEKSGALITASYALHEGRDVGVVPGSIFDPLSAGCHRLLNEGATIVSSEDDLIKFLGGESSATQGSAIVGSTTAGSATVGFVAAGNQESQQLEIGAEEGGGIDALIMRTCAQSCSFDDFVEKTALSASDLHALLWDLQLAGKIEQTSSGLWQASRRTG